nr:uncharacterized protein LOC109183794 [Ipomoea batatas]
MKNMLATHLFSQYVSVGTPQSVSTPCDLPQTRSSCHSVDAYPIAKIKVILKVISYHSVKRCRLAVCPGVTPIIVATCVAHPSTYGIVVHQQRLLPNCVKVFVNEVVDCGEQFNIPMPAQQYATVGDIFANFAQWPMYLVILDEGHDKALYRGYADVQSVASGVGSLAMRNDLSLTTAVDPRLIHLKRWQPFLLLSSTLRPSHIKQIDWSSRSPNSTLWSGVHSQLFLQNHGQGAAPIHILKTAEIHLRCPGNSIILVWVRMRRQCTPNLDKQTRTTQNKAANAISTAFEFIEMNEVSCGKKKGELRY